jgi:multiple sugar transport system ATP-binding protein
MAQVLLKNIAKYYNKTKVIEELNLSIKDQEFVVLVGPSGCGKSTLLRMIAGLEEISDGELYIGDRLSNELEPKDRNIAMVFQNYALYPHLTVKDNISFGLRATKMDKQEIEKRVAHAADILGVTHLLDRKPSELSGGQSQRIAMGRAIVRQPEVFLFDEPLSNLDAKLRANMRVEIKKLHQRVKTTSIYVTHDQVEAMTLADRIVILKGGDIQQIGTPMDLYHTPANVFVATFIGNPPMNILNGTLTQNNDNSDENWCVKFSDTESLSFSIDKPLTTYQDKPVKLGVRPEDIRVLRNNEQPQSYERVFSVQAAVIEPLGADTTIFTDIAGMEIKAITDGRHTIHLNDTLKIAIDTRHLHLFDAQTEERVFSTQVSVKVQN